VGVDALRRLQNRPNESSAFTVRKNCATLRGPKLTVVSPERKIRKRGGEKRGGRKTRREDLLEETWER